MFVARKMRRVSRPIGAENARGACGKNKVLCALHALPPVPVELRVPVVRVRLEVFLSKWGGECGKNAQTNVSHLFSNPHGYAFKPGKRRRGVAPKGHAGGGSLPYIKQCGGSYTTCREESANVQSKAKGGGGGGGGGSPSGPTGRGGGGPG